MGAPSGVDIAAFTPQQVLSFWFGEGVWGSPDMGSTNFSACLPLWWGMKPDFSGPVTPGEKEANDNRAKQFSDLIRACGRGELTDASWQSADGLYAQMLLCDQLSRNCFRGTDEAFAFDTKAVECTRSLFAQKHYLTYQTEHEFVFLITPMQHSEDAKDHEISYAILSAMADKFGSDHPGYTRTKKFQDDHYKVIQRFGRYPHRNAALGRESTAEEAIWLADYDNLPVWAKSQLPKPKPS